MASLLRTYKSSLVEGKGLFLFSVLFAAAIRIVYFLSFENLNLAQGDGYLWKPIASLFSNSIASVITSAVFVGGMAFYATHINTKYMLIRCRTIYPAAVFVLLFSCHPSFIFMSAEYISAFLFLYVLSMLFSSYNEGDKQARVFKASFMLSLGSLFTPVVLVYIPILWIAFGIMRCFNLKAILASLLGVFVLYFPFFSYYILQRQLDAFLYPFVSINPATLKELFIFDFTATQWGLLAFVVVLIIIVISDNYINRHKDKIKIRAFISLLSFLLIVSILMTLFLNITPKINVYIALITGGFLVSHFYALAERGATVILFCFSIIIYILVCFLPFLSI